MDIQRLQQQLLFFRLTFADRPFWLFAAVIVACLIGLAPFRHRADANEDANEDAGAPRRGWPALPTAILAICTYLAIVAWYLFKEPYYDFAEPTMAAVAWLFHLGQPVYHTFDAAARYSHMYGPMAFIIPGWFLAAAGPGIMASKGAGILAGLLGLGIMYRVTRSATGRRNAILLTGVFVMLCLMYRNLSFWLRPDSYLLLFTSSTLLAATWRRQWLAAIGVGLGTGLLLNLKITGVLYALPAFGLLMARFGVWPVAVAGGTTAVTALLPFVAFDNVSLANYLLWIRMSAKNGLMFTTLRQNVEWALFLLIPLAPTMLAAPPAWLSIAGRRWLYGSFLLGLAGVVVAASKPGAGSYHLMQFWPFVIYAVALHADALPAALRTDALYRAGRLAFVIVITLIAFTQQVVFVAATKLTDHVDAIADLTAFADANPGKTIDMGFANDRDRLTYFRPALVFKTGHYLIDPPAVQEYQMSGIDLPAATLDALRRCAVDLWLIPQGSTPFNGPNKYPMTGYRELFPDSFKQAFFDHYEHTRDTRYFQVWSCREPASW
jgi:hypothetical protein